MIPTIRNDSSESDIVSVKGGYIATAVVIVCLLACAPAAESQDDDLNIPPPTTFVDTDFVRDELGRAQGEVIRLVGKVVDEQGQAVPGAIIFVRQTDVRGRYLNTARRANAVDPHFQYEGWIQADENGRFELLTIAPGAYVRSDTAIPHLHMQARAGKLVSTYHTVVFPQYPPRNGSRDYLQRTDKWILIVDLEERSDKEAVYAGEFEIIVR